ncbi:WGR domain-containing protein [Microvirga sp. HBU67558]|uniref:WGR domain-containing protein n=1 Tax=Microvirga sp. HBU67558 TaxID=2824562 RepID=UPI001B3665B4|nr:WGR domain-containing protein [Microvirga sp. HBU67558]MBQ0820974.1 WGR domain-containing protein [Microvirga sp. HBU67558]
MPKNEPQRITLERWNSASSTAQFYSLAVEPTLFGDTALVRAWGRIGLVERRRIDLYETQEQAAEALNAWLKRKRKRGYVTLE